MLLFNDGDAMKINGKEYTVGIEIYCNEKSDYAGLFGRILEIRDGEDKETDSDTVDIICGLNPPENAEIALKLEKRFSELYGKPMTLKNISLDYTIMAPEMIDLPEDLDRHARRYASRQPNVRVTEIARNRARAVMNDADAPFGSPERQRREREYNQATRVYNETRRSVETNIRNLYNTLTVLMHNVESQEIDLMRAQERLETVMLNYQAGQASRLDKEAAELAILQVEIAIERSLNDFWNLQFLFLNPFIG